jgi:inosine/xanthosine triphosphate pyrophosphatase family protein
VPSRGSTVFGEYTPSRCNIKRLTIDCPGWDSAFEYPEFGQTYAEMPKDEKNKISHRGKALDKLKAWLKDNTD